MADTCTSRLASSGSSALQKQLKSSEINWFQWGSKSFRAAVWAAALVASTSTVCSALFSGTLLAWWAHGRPGPPLAWSIGGGDMLIIVLAIVLMFVVHELIHGMVMRVFGYQVSYGIGWHMGGFYTAAFQQFVTRDHAIIIALAPLLVITPLGLVVMLLLPVWFGVIVALMVVICNTAGAVGDMYLTWRLLWLPCATLLYDVSIQRMLIYEPHI
jgi:hypothetical protein